MTPYADIIAVVAREKRPTRASFDTKMLYLKGDLIVNDNAWSKLMQQADKFIATFNKVCHKHDVKTVHRPGSNQEFPKKLKLLQQTVHRYGKWYNAALDCNRTPDESTFIRLARAQTHFKKEKKAWQCRMRQKFYAGVVGDFIANDHKRVWLKLRSQTKLNSVVETVNPVKDSEGVLLYHTDKILQAMKDQYEELLMYDPDGRTSNYLGEQGVEMTDLNDGLDWPEVLFTIRGMNRNMAPGKDEIHINVLKIMVRGNVWQRSQSGCIPEQWQEVHIINLFKGGDSESTNNYRGISLISCALKVLFCLMAKRLSNACEENGLLCMEQAGFRPREEAVAQATALAKLYGDTFWKATLPCAPLLTSKKHTTGKRCLETMMSDDEEDTPLEELYAAHEEAAYSTPEGVIPTVTTYKYLGITVDETSVTLGKLLSNTSTDAFTLSYKLGLPPMFLEMSAARARLGLKMKVGSEPLKTWIQQLFRNQVTYKTRHQTWVTQTNKWLLQVEKEKHKYARTIYYDVQSPYYHLEGRRIVEHEDGEENIEIYYHKEESVPLRPWAQIGKCLEMRVQLNAYWTEFMEKLISKMTGEQQDGGALQTPLLNDHTGIFDVWWNGEEYRELSKGLVLPKGRMTGEAQALLLKYYGVTRGFLREAINQPDLAEGVHWLSLTRSGAFPQVERAWQHMKRSGKIPGFARRECPLCNKFLPILDGDDLAHLLVACKSHQTYIWESSENVLSEIWGTENRTLVRERAVSTYLLGGFVRHTTMVQHGMEWFDIYQLGFGHFQLVTPGFTTQHFIPMASFLQEVAPLWTFALGQEVYDGGSVMDSLSQGSLLEGAVNQEHEWLDEESETQRNLQHREVWQEVPDVDETEDSGPSWLVEVGLLRIGGARGPQVLNQKPKSNDMALLNVLVPEHMDIT
ncbi:hypothetical protein EI94DRAFT_1708406 [Lactarius quietus]|nr:hypothetical protein EI94DRAFT_1708406 [Lactarius quietus]